MFYQDFEKKRLVETDLYERGLITSIDEYEAKKKQEQEIKLQIQYRKKLLNEANVIEQVSFAITTALGAITRQFIDAVDNHYPEMKAKLQGQATLLNGSTITDPYNSRNLSGMYMILYHEYNKPNLVVICSQLVELLQERNYEDPTRAKSDVLNHLKSWSQLDLWQYMDEDKFFTVALIMKFSTKTEFRQKLLSMS